MGASPVHYPSMGMVRVMVQNAVIDAVFHALSSPTRRKVLERLSIGPAFLFLIAAEAIASDVGLGYRIFLVRRYLAMETILPYVAWITLIAYVLDFALATLARRGFRWAYAEERR